MNDHDEWADALDDEAWNAYHDAEEAAHAEYVAGMTPCPACGDFIDYCQGHGESGDPEGFAVLEAHDAGEHGHCHAAAGCEAEDYV